MSREASYRRLILISRDNRFKDGLASKIVETRDLSCRTIANLRKAKAKFLFVFKALKQASTSGL